MVDIELLSIYVREMRYKLKIGLRNLNMEKNATEVQSTSQVSLQPLESTPDVALIKEQP